MSAPTPVPEERPQADEQLVQRFLELAAPIFLDHPVLDEETWEQLRSLARQTGLSESDLTLVVKSLQREGVVRPRRHSPSGASPGPDARAPEPPPLPTPPPPPVAPGTAPGRWADSDEWKLFTSFLDRARGILSERRGLDAAGAALLADLAHSMGLSEEQFDEALRVLGGDHADVEAPPMPARPPTPELRRRDPQPAETFCRYLQLAIADKNQHRGYISASAERRLAEEGVRKLGLAAVYARHLVQQIAEELQVPVLSREQAAPNEGEDPKFDEFLTRAFSVLAQERGMTPRAKMLLAAIAQELALEDRVVPIAMRMLQRQISRGNSRQAWRQERRDAFRGDMRRHLGRLAGSFLAPPAFEELLWQGEQLYGVAPDEARSLIHEAGAALGVAIFAPEQAAQYMAALIREKMGYGSRLTADAEWELLAQGEQWGLSAEELRALVQQCADDNRRRRARERNITSAALGVACLSVVVVLGIFYYMFIGDRLPWTSQPNTDPPTADDTARSIPSSSESTASGSTTDTNQLPGDSEAARDGWDAELLALLVRVRRDASEQRKADLAALQHADPARRRQAYRELADWAVADAEAATRLLPLGELLATAAARDPHESAADQLVATLLAALPEAGAEPPANDDAYLPMFAAARMLAAMIDRVPKHSTRAHHVAVQLSEKLGEGIAPGANSEETESRCFAPLLRRIYRNLARGTGRLSPALVATHARRLELYAARYLSRREYDTLAADLLRQALPAAGTSWRVYDDLLESSLTSRDPLHALKLVDALEKADDEDLQRYLSAILAERAGITAGEGTVEDLTRRMRSALGAPSTPTANRNECLTSFREAANTALRESVASDQQQLVEQIARLANLNTQGFALLRDDLATYEQRSRPDTGLALGDRLPASGGREISPAEIEQRVQPYTTKLRLANSMRDRIAALDILAGMATTIPDVHPAHAEDLANYLLSRRNVAEHRERMVRLNGLKRWNNLHIGLAHAAGQLKVYEEQAEEVLVKLLEEPLGIPATATDWGVQVRQHLLAQALQLLATAGSDSSAPQPLNTLQFRLREEWQAQARLARVPAAELAGPAPASQLLRSCLLTQAADRKSQAGISPETVRSLADIPHRVVALEYSARNDLERTVLLDRLWLEVLAQTHDDSSAGKEGQQLVQDVLREDLAAADLLHQLRISQAGHVRLWLLRLKKEL
jgi:hypothetical protein